MSHLTHCQLIADFQTLLTWPCWELLVFGGPTREIIDVMIPDCLLPPVGGDVRVDLRHLVTLSLFPMDMSDCVPAPNLDRALCPNSLDPTLGLQRREYWEEINLLLAKWKNVNDTRCPECARLIRVNMARHLRLVHSEYVCFWWCPITSCSLWFTCELNTKDHIENIHWFREGRGTSFYEEPGVRPFTPVFQCCRRPAPAGIQHTTGHLCPAPVTHRDDACRGGGL